MDPRPAPSAEGSFDRTPLAHVLLYVRGRALSGTLAVQCGDAEPEVPGESLLAFEHGALTQVRLPRVLDPLGFVLLERGAITQAQLDDSLRRVAQGEGLQGELLVRAGACGPDAVERALREQLRRKALRLFAAREATYQYFEGADLLADYGGARVAEDVLPVLWRGVRAHPDVRAVGAVLQRAQGQRAQLREGAELRAFEFDRSERGPLDLLRAGPASLEELARAANDPRRARLLLYVLLISKQVDLVAATATPSRGVTPPARWSTPSRGVSPPRAPAPTPPTLPAAPPPAPAPVPEPPAELPAEDPPPAEVSGPLAEAQQRFAAMQEESYFQMLGVEPTASSEQVRDAFLALATRWHPDRVVDAPVALREVFQRVFALLNEAQEVLCDDAQRGRYLNTVREGGGTPNAQRKMAALIEAATDAQKAEVCLRRREYDEAARLARRALEVSPDDPVTLTLLASALVARWPEGPHEEPEALLRRAVELAPKSDRAHTLLGTLYKRRGEEARALVHFRQAAELNANNLDAMREVRIAAMRAQHAGAGGQDGKDAGKSPSGFLSKLLKR